LALKITIVAVGQRVPAWAQAAWDDYTKRFPPDIKIELKTIKTEPRASKTVENLLELERARIEAAAQPALNGGAQLIALDERGAPQTTRQLAARLRGWQNDGQDVVLLIGGPDGLAASLKARAQTQMRLSDLTLPHAMVRVLLVEQLYRAWSLNAGHPYHRE
jgi:23S rRNA (pseudouridine1915-N3)-methyltransferase